MESNTIAPPELPLVYQLPLPGFDEVLKYTVNQPPSLIQAVSLSATANYKCG